MQNKPRLESYSWHRNNRVQRKKTSGASPVETAVVVSIVGCVLAAFVPTFVRNTHLSKSSEAVRVLEEMHLGASAYFLASNELGAHCLPGPSGPLPASPSAARQEVDFASDPTFAALGLNDTRELRYSYWFEPYETGCNIGPSAADEYAVVYRAEGDLDDDSQRSTFERRDRVTANHTLEPIGILYVRDRIE